MLRDPYLAALTDIRVDGRVSECNESLAELDKLYPTDARSQCQAYWLRQRYEALSELYARQKRRAI